MEINRLSQEELSYELVVRGLPIGSVDDMRKVLRASTKAEKAQALDCPEYPFKFSEDKEALAAKIVEVNVLLEEFWGDPDCSEYKKLLTKIQWALGRLKRCKPDDAEQEKEKIRLKGELIVALGTLQSKAEGKFSGDDSDSEAGGPFLSSTTLPNDRSKVAIYKWGLRFSGENGQSLNSFLERVMELAEARGVSKQKLFKSALDLFEGRALIWYRAYKNRVQCWTDLVRELRKEYLPPDYDDRLMDEIRRRTQGKEESIGMYVAIMESLFSRLTIPVTEAQQLRILRRNISPFYQTQLGLSDVETVSELVDLGRKLESVRSSVEEYVPPPSRRSNNLLEPDLAYVSSERARVSAIEPRNQPSSTRCLNCKEVGHWARNCRRPRRCFGCGALGVIRSTCPNCSPPNNRHQPTKSMGNERRVQQ